MKWFIIYMFVSTSGFHAFILDGNPQGFPTLAACEASLARIEAADPPLPQARAVCAGNNEARLQWRPQS